MTTAKVKETVKNIGIGQAQLGATFTFKLNSFRITDTRSRHKDTDFASLTLSVNPGGKMGKPQTQNKSMGDLNNGTFQVGLQFANVHVNPTDTVTFNYLIVNNGHQSESSVYGALDTAGGNLAKSGLVAAGAALGSLLPIPGVGTILGAVAGWLVGKVEGILDPNCDGTVAVEQAVFTYQDLLNKTASGPFKHETKHPGTDSPSGCGSNSVYYVDWEIDQVARQQTGKA